MKTSLLISLFLLFAIGLFALTGHGTSSVVSFDFVAPRITLVSPNGGEMWYNQAVYDIEWLYEDLNPHPGYVTLYYSLNETSWYEIGFNYPNDGIEPWTLPLINSNTVKVRIDVTDLYLNNAMDFSDNNFIITSLLPPLTPEHVVINIVNDTDAVIAWDAVTEDILGNPVTPDGYIILYNETPGLDDELFYFLTSTSGLSFTHNGVAHFRDDMYYRIVAYLDDEGRITDYLAGISSDSRQKRNWAAIKADLRLLMGGDK